LTKAFSRGIIDTSRGQERGIKMYKVTIKTRGKDGNAALGARYCLTKRSAISLAVTFESFECEYDVEKFVRLHGDIFAWSDAMDEDFWEKVYEALDNEPEE
jgi:hypothetical protein